MAESILDERKTDAIGELFNVAMGSGAAAASNMIDSTVSVTNPQVFVMNAGEIAKTKLRQTVKGILFGKGQEEIFVKIDYSQGIEGSSVLVFNCDDLQMFVNKLMGLPMEIDEDYEFDEMGLSAVGEVLNQMMGAAATSISQMINDTVSITPPQPIVSVDNKNIYKLSETSADETVCAISFDLIIDDVLESRFAMILSEELAGRLAAKLLGEDFDDYYEDEEEEEEIDYSDILSPEKMDAIGEIQNISMGSAATSLSNLMDAKVTITTPQVSVNKAGSYDFDDLDPSICIRIKYVKGIHGASVMVLKQSDVQLMVCRLMGMPLEVTDDFEFDEMNTSAVCEIMNQMMGASATTLSEIIGTPTDISTPEAIVIDSIDEILSMNNIEDNDDVCAISFDLSIDGIMNSHFVTMLSIDLANEMADKMINSYYIDEPEPEPEPVKPAPKKEKPKAAPAPKPKAAPAAPKEEPQSRVISSNSAAAKNMKVEKFTIADLDGDEETVLSEKQKHNLNSLLDVPMEITVRIGQTQKSIDEVGNFMKGTVIELDALADEPVDVLVNGNLIAKGEVVVVDDNFAIRITEIISKI